MIPIVTTLKAACLAVLLCMPTVISAQEEDFSIVEVDSTWRQEILQFPIDWTPKMNVQGFEELRFAPHWPDKNHEEFWSLVMSWSIISDSEISPEDLKLNLEGYFDGLMKPNHWAKEFPEPNVTFFEFTKTIKGTSFKGTMHFFDGFHSGELITTHILGSQVLCKTTGKTIIIFKFSPQEYGSPVWDQLNNINMKDHICN
jgi:hypothetical protein